MIKCFCLLLQREKAVIHFPQLYRPALLLQRWHVYFQFYAHLSPSVPKLLRARCVPDSPDMENTGWTWHPVLSALWGLRFSLVSSCQSVGDESLKRSLKKVASYICLVSRRSCFFFFPSPSFFCAAVAIRVERLGIVFCFLRQLERVTGCLAIGPAGKEADGSILMSPCLLGRDIREQVEKDLQTHTHTHTQTELYMHARADALTNISQQIQYAVTHVCVESSNTHFSIYIGGFHLTLLSTDT